MLEALFSRWKGKLFVLALLGFVATDFVITITLSAADATAHIIENPFVPHWAHDYRIGITLFLIGLLGGVFLKGFKEAIGIAVGLVIIYLALNAVVMFVSFHQLFLHPEFLAHWKTALVTPPKSPWTMLGLSLLVFPKLALGLSGFETGVAVMPLVKSEDGTLEKRIANTKKLLVWAAIIMSVFLLASSVATIFLIPAREFLPREEMLKQFGLDRAGEANGRALAYIAHKYLGNAFGTIYDISTICILWFAGASAMAAMLNLVPRYLPRYGMAPDWARAARPLVVVFTTVAFAVTIHFRADVDKQGGAYATGVLVLITSAAVAAMLSARRAGQGKLAGFFGAVGLIFLYTTLQNIRERPDGLAIASIFISSIIGVSLLSRIYRSIELRAERIEIDPLAQQFINEAVPSGLHFIANEPDARDEEEYRLKEQEQREDNHIPHVEPVLFLEVTVADHSEFADVIEVRGEERFGYKILRVEGSTVPNTIAALLLHVRDTTGKNPHAYFSWTEGNPMLYILQFIAFGQGDIAPVTREVLRLAEPDPQKRPHIHVGG